MIGLLFVLFACEENTFCTEVGCLNGVTAVFLGPDGEEVHGVKGDVNIDGQSISFDCTNGGDEYICEGNEVVFFVEEGEDFSYNIFMDGPYMGQGEESIDWEESTPNGEECPPVCYNASIEIYLDRSVEPQ